MTKNEVLKQYFGYSDFRKGQNSLIDNILNKKDVLGIMPTGAGKSVCFQVPALMLSGITIVISPLVSLMKDQVQALISAGVSAAFINSSLTPLQTQKAIQNAADGKYKIIYVAPERLNNGDFVTFARFAHISMVTVDEAHCVSQWGQDFRPNYLLINDFISLLPYRPVISAFTATATQAVKDDIINILQLNSPFIMTTGFDRENLYFEVQHPADKYASVLKYLENHSDQSGIIYCSTRKTVESLCTKLNKDGYNSTCYHGGLSPLVRTKNQDDFLYDRKPIMIATNAFGMGIDKSNVNFVIHYNMPKNIESYYQEAGRAGRDGTKADCILLYSTSDIITNQFFIENGSSSQSSLTPEKAMAIKENDREKLNQMINYCNTYSCLRFFILDYFSQADHSQCCENCSNCNDDSTVKTIDVLQDSQKIISCIYRMKQRFGENMVIDTLRGKSSKRITQFELNRLSTYGIMADTSIGTIKEIINFLIVSGYLIQTAQQYPILQCTKKAKELLHCTYPLLMKTGKYSYDKIKSRSPKGQKQIEFGGNVNEALLSALKALRSTFATNENVPAYIVFSDATLLDMCKRLPKTEDEMLSVSGVGKVKFDRYGSAFLQEIAKYSSSDLAADNSPKITTKAELIDYVVTNFPNDDGNSSVSVSVLAGAINSLLLRKSNCKITAAKITKFLENRGYLETIEEDNSKQKCPTEKGSNCGITTEEKENFKGITYTQILYSKEVQRYVLDNLDKII